MKDYFLNAHTKRIIKGAAIATARILGMIVPLNNWAKAKISNIANNHTTALAVGWSKEKLYNQFMIRFILISPR